VANVSDLLVNNDDTSDLTSTTLPFDQDPGAVDSSQSWLPFATEQPEPTANLLPDDTFFLDETLFTFGDTPNLGPVGWFDLLADDAINSMQGQPQGNRWNFDIDSLSRRQSPRPSIALDGSALPFDGADVESAPILHRPWNTESRIELKPEEVIYFEHFVNVVAPIWDLFDPAKHIANAVPHLALRNVGLLKSVLAVGACHLAIMQHPSPGDDVPIPAPVTPTSSLSASSSTSRLAEQYYYETLQYLSQNLFYEAYTTSHEILATAIMISTYEVSKLGLRVFASLPLIRHLLYRCSAQSTILITATGTAICAEHFGFRRPWVSAESPQTGSIVRCGGPGYARTYGPPSAQGARL
jgi:hypothetical protein